MRRMDLKYNGYFGGLPKDIRDYVSEYVGDELVYRIIAEDIFDLVISDPKRGTNPKLLNREAVIEYFVESLIDTWGTDSILRNAENRDLNNFQIATKYVDEDEDFVDKLVRPLNYFLLEKPIDDDSKRRVSEVIRNNILLYLNKITRYKKGPITLNIVTIRPGLAPIKRFSTIIVNPDTHINDIYEHMRTFDVWMRKGYIGDSEKNTYNLGSTIEESGIQDGDTLYVYWI